MLNFRKIKQDLSPATVKKGQSLYEEGNVFEAVVKEFNAAILKLNAKVKSSFDKTFICQLEIDKRANEIAFSKCSCSKKYDCEHVMAALSFVETNLDDLLAKFVKGSKGTALKKSKTSEIVTLSTQKLKDASAELMEATQRYKEKQNKQLKTEIVHEYRHSWSALANSPFFIKKPDLQPAIAQLYLILDKESIYPLQKTLAKNGKHIGTQAMVSIRLPGRVKPIQLPDLLEFFESVEFQETMIISGQKVLLTRDSFSVRERLLLDELLRLQVSVHPKASKKIILSPRVLGRLFHVLYENLCERPGYRTSSQDEQDCRFHLDPIFLDSLDQPLMARSEPLGFEVSFDYLKVDSPKIMLNMVLKDQQKTWKAGEALLLPNLVPGALVDYVYCPFKEGIHRGHLKDFVDLQDLIIPEPMFGTLTEHGLRRLKSYAKVKGTDSLSKLITMPCIEQPKVEVNLTDNISELEAHVTFVYEGKRIPATEDQTDYNHIKLFLANGTSLGRDIWFESEVLYHLFSDFQYEEETKSFIARSERQILDFMTRVIPSFESFVQFQSPPSLLARYAYEKTVFRMRLEGRGEVSEYGLVIDVEGPLEGVTLSQIRECLHQNRTYLRTEKGVGKGRLRNKKDDRIAVIDLQRLAPIVSFFDDLGIEKLQSTEFDMPLWSLAHIDHELIDSMDIEFSMDDKVIELETQLKGNYEFTPSAIPKAIKADLRSYQVEGVEWLEKLRFMHLGGVLADDMGLGKTLQTICAISQLHESKKNSVSLVVCPSSLIYNWKEEINKFNPELSCEVIEGVPKKRMTLIKSKKHKSVLITSYSLMQKDIELYENMEFAYLVLDEAHYIKNKNTMNAKSVKQLNSQYKLLLTGTPVENSIEELWSLFDFLMKGLLGSYDRFSEKYTRPQNAKSKRNRPKLSKNDLKEKIAPFIIRRMKSEVLDDLPPINEITYHCHLTQTQQDLYQNFSENAKRELSALVEKEGFEKVQIHVLATLTRLKQICCHPAIFAKEQAQVHDSAKYDLFLNIVDNIIENKRKAVVFSQYTKMLSIMREDFIERGVRFSYLDGTSKNRLEIVKEFNSNPEISIFLVSLKAGGSGLNLVGADTVIHYDMWWNPAVENQATDRVHRMGQTQKVSSYKLVTLGTIEEKIVQMQERKRSLVKNVISSDDDVMSKLTWNEVLQLLSKD